MILLSQASVLFLAVIIPGIIAQSPLKELSTPLIGVLTLIYLLTSFTSGKKSTEISDEVKKRNSLRETVSTACLTSVIILILFLTGGISSPFFFLLYFLAFAIGFLLHPEVVFFYVLGTTLLFSPSIQGVQVLDNIIKLGSLTLFSPLAYFFGRELQERFYEDVYHDRATACNTFENIRNDVQEIIKNEKETLKAEDVERLNDILEETEGLEKDK